MSGQAGLSLASREEMVDETAMQRLIPLRLNRRGPGLAVGDVDGSGHDAVVVGGTTLSPGAFFCAGRGPVRGRRRAPCAGRPPPSTTARCSSLTPRAMGRQDLLVTRGGNALPAGSPEYQPRLLLNDGQGGFRPAPEGALPELALNAGAVAAADFDHSGRLGLFIGGRVLSGQYPLAPRSVLLANRGGRFEDVTDRLAPGLREVGMVTSALWSDVDGDGWPDLLLTLEWGNVKYFHNNRGSGFEDWTERSGFASAGTGWWTSIASADFNGDGRPDYVVGNVGLNTQYRASPERPALLYYGDFTGEGEEPLTIEAYYEGDRLYPWRCRRDMGAAVHGVLRRFPRNDAYARATLGEILGEDRLAAAQRFAATELRSGVLPEPARRHLSVRAPAPDRPDSPLQGLAAGDFDGDGHADIYAVQNSYAPIPPVGRFDGAFRVITRNLRAAA